MTALTDNNFLIRYARAFGRTEARMLQVTGLLGGEHSAAGAWIADISGRRWLDFGSFGMHLLGHRHPAVVAAAREQLDLMGLSGKVLGNAAATRCAESLLAVTDAHLNRVLLANTGGEAVDMAVKMALLSTGRDELLAFDGSFHGRVVAALSLSDAAPGRDQVGLRNKVHFLPLGDLDRVAAVLRDRRVAAVFIEPVQGEGGVRPVDPGFLRGLRDVCTETGTLLVLDEIQTGLGRCGTLWRSAGACVPDMLLVGKQLGGGLVPLSAVVHAGSLIGPAAKDPLVQGSSFAGGALAGRIGVAVLDIVSDEALLQRVRSLGDHALSLLRSEFSGDERVCDVRGEGLMLGVEVADAGLAGKVILEAAHRDLLLSFCVNRPSVLRVYPPVVASDEDVESGLSALVDAVRACRLPESTREKVA